MQKLTAGFDHAIEAHKLLEWRHVDNGSVARGVAKGDLPAVVLTQLEHAEVTQMLYERLPYRRPYTPAELWEAYDVVYTRYGHPEWLQYIEKYFR